MRVLLAEDNADLREMLTLALEYNGWEVVAVGDGREALKAYHNADGAFDVLLLDVQMPRLNGVAVGVLVRRFEDFTLMPRAVLVYLTGKGDVVPPEQLLGADFAGTQFANAYIRKPVTGAELTERIEGLLKNAGDETGS